MSELTTLEPNQYFDYVKSQIAKTTEADIKDLFALYTEQANRSLQIGQHKLFLKLAFNSFIAMRELRAVEAGYDKWISTEGLTEFIKNTKTMGKENSFGGGKNTVKVIELANYTRPIPAEAMEKISDVVNHKYKMTPIGETHEKEFGLFDELYVVYTDLTGCEATEEYVRKNKDPIVFGAFKDKMLREQYGRLYFICDWEDEYCNLTFNSMIREMDKKSIKGHGKGVDMDEFINHINKNYHESKLKLNSNNERHLHQELSYWQRVKLALKCLLGFK